MKACNGIIVLRELSRGSSSFPSWRQNSSTSTRWPGKEKSILLNTNREEGLVHLKSRYSALDTARRLQIVLKKRHLRVHPLRIGGKADPARLVFNARRGPAINAYLVDLVDRFRMVANEVDIVSPDEPLSKLPMAHAVWAPKPDLETAATAWIYAGGSHHTALSQALTAVHLEDFAEMVGIEFLRIDEDTRVDEFRNALRWNSTYFSLNSV